MNLKVLSIYLFAGLVTLPLLVNGAEAIPCATHEKNYSPTAFGKVKSVSCLNSGEPIWLIYRKSLQRYDLYAPSIQRPPFPIAKYDPKLDPALVGAEGYIKLLTPKSVRDKDADFIPAIFAQRSRSGDGGGQCGSGVELSLIVVRIDQQGIQKYKPVPLESCLKDVYLDDDGMNKLNAITVEDGQLHIHWQSYPGYESEATGILDLQTGTVSIRRER